MNRQRNFQWWTIVRALVQTVMVILLVAAFQMVGSPALADDPCNGTSNFAQKACINSAKEVYNLDLGKCQNVAAGDYDDCIAAAVQVQKDSFSACDDLYAARQVVCRELNNGKYLPGGVVPSDFTSRLNGNRYFPLSPATYTTKTYAPDGKTIVETDVVKVTDQTTQIQGVTCRIVKDSVYDKDGNLTEYTVDYYAQDKHGNVWYFGENASQYTSGIVTGVEGSWIAGDSGFKPGYIMLASPEKGDVYRQEFALGEAEDMGKVVETNLANLPSLPVKLPRGVHGPYLHTQDFSALEPDSVLNGKYEDKYYAPGVGVVVIIPNDGSGNTEVLVSITYP